MRLNQKHSRKTSILIKGGKAKKTYILIRIISAFKGRLHLTDRFLDSVESYKFVSYQARMSGKFNSTKDSQPTKVE